MKKRIFRMSDKEGKEVMSKSMRLRSSVPIGVPSTARMGCLMACGFSEEELNRPLIGIMNQWSEVHPGHVHLQRVSEFVKKGVIEGGGTPIEVNTIGLCDGVIMPNRRYTLPHRDLMVNDIEVAAEANLFDGMVLLSTCDKNVPAQLMAAARINIPSILVTGGYMLPGFYKGKEGWTGLNCIEAVPLVKNKQIEEKEFIEMIEHGFCTPGACPDMTTANTMQCVSEALGMSLPGNGTVFAGDVGLLRIARNAGKQLMYLLEKDICPRDIITEESIKNAVKVVLAIGGSIHSLYHIPAICVEAGMDLDVRSMFDEYSREIPLLIRIRPNGEHTMRDFDRAGGLRALMKNLSEKLNLDVITVTGKPLRHNLEDAQVFDPSVIHTMDSPAGKEGGIAIFKGNIAEEGAVLRLAGFSENIKAFAGKAKVFPTENEAIDALNKGEIEDGRVIVIPYQGLKGAPGINTLLPITSEIHGKGLEEKLAVITDGRLSGAAHGLALGLVCPEAAEGGGIALVKDGDLIEINVPKRKVNVKISNEEFERRKREWKPPPKKPVDSVYLSIYLQSVQSLSKGAVLGDPSIRR